MGQRASNIMVMGCKGVGKTTLAKNLATRLGAQDVSMFQAATSSAHRQGIVSCSIVTAAPLDPRFQSVTTTNDTHPKSITTITDTPSLVDNHGSVDEDSIRMIVEHARNLTYLNGIFLVLNEQNPGLDEGMQDALKLMVNSFGPHFLSNLGMAFTFSDGRLTPQQSQAQTAEILATISDCTDLPMMRRPFWQIQFHPESLAGCMDEEAITAIQQNSLVTMGEMARWAQSCLPIATKDAEYAERQDTAEDKQDVMLHV